MKWFILILLMAMGQASASQMIDDDYDNVDPYQNKLLTADVDGFKSLYKSIVEECIKQEEQNVPAQDREYASYRPRDLYQEFYRIAQSLYLEGIAKEEHFEKWKQSYIAILNRVEPTPLPANFDRKQFWTDIYAGVFDPYLDRIVNAHHSCANEGEETNLRKCCRGLFPINKRSAQAGSCKTVGNTCNANSDCCSGGCDKVDANSPGKCLAQKICVRENKEGQACDPNTSPVCKDSACISTDITQVLSYNSCKKTTTSCQLNQECCSGTCFSGKCIENFRCMKCKKEGSKLERNEICCPGYIKLDNKCVLPMPVFVPTVQVENMMEKFFVKAWNLFFPAAYANDDLATSTTAGQAELLQKKREECAKRDPDKQSERYKACIEEIEQQATAFADDNFLPLTQKQTTEIEEAKGKCNTNFTTGSTELTDCLTKVDKKEKEFLADNQKVGEKCAKQFDEGSTKYKRCLIDAGAMGVALGAAERLSKYQVPAITAKTYSNIKKCEFNSFNDSWRDATNQEKNAEVFLRSFEYVHSHLGVKDYWVESGSRSIFERANDAAKKFRENRSKLLQEMVEIDKKMACKCIAIFGPKNFDGAKQNFFQSNCEEEKAQLQADLATTVGEGPSKIDGTTSVEGKGKVAKDEASTEEVDKSAIGISQEKLLIEWLGLRADAQVARFVDNSDLEEDLNELSEYISTINAYEVNYDRVQGKSLIMADPRGNGQELYKWGYTYPSGLVQLLTKFVGFAFSPSAGAFGAEISDMVLDIFYGSSSSGSGRLGSKEASAYIMQPAWQYSEDDKLTPMPKIVDVRTEKKCVRRILGACVKRMKGYTRYYLGPRFSGPEASFDTTCQVDARSSSCVKNVFMVDYDNAYSFILDPTLPLFVPAGRINLNNMEGTNKPLNELINRAHTDGVAYLKNLVNRCGGGIRKAKEYRDCGRNWGSRPHVKNAISNGYFLPDRGNLEIPVFGDRRRLIIEGARKYAMCKNLIECGGPQVTITDKDIGFGYLFEVDSEAKSFAEYTYEIHYKWARMSKNNYAGYPLVGLSQYYKLVAYNMKLVGSTAASRAQNYFQAYQLYQSDLGDRLSEYQSLGQASMGTLSRDIKYKKPFYDAFAKLNFSGASDIQSFSSQLNSLKVSGQLSSAEVVALSAGRANALRRNKDIAAKEKLDTALVNADVKTKQAFAQNANFLNEKVNAPLSSFGVQKLGGKISGNKKLAKAINNLNKNIRQLNERNSEKDEKSGIGNYKVGFGNIPNFRSNFSTATTNIPGNDIEGSAAVNDVNMSDEEVRALLRNLKKDKALVASENDTLFARVSKAYKRNYSKVLKRNSTITETKLAPKEDITDKNKAELKKLISN